MRFSSLIQIALGKTNVTVMDKDDQPPTLPLLTMTGISDLKAKK